MKNGKNAEKNFNRQKDNLTDNNKQYSDLYINEKTIQSTMATDTNYKCTFRICSSVKKEAKNASYPHI